MCSFRGWLRSQPYPIQYWFRRLRRFPVAFRSAAARCLRRGRRIFTQFSRRHVYAIDRSPGGTAPDGNGPDDRAVYAKISGKSDPAERWRWQIAVYAFQGHVACSPGGATTLVHDRGTATKTGDTVFQQQGRQHVLFEKKTGCLSAGAPRSNEVGYTKPSIR